MTISTLDAALAGMQSPIAIAKALSGTLVAGRPQSYWPVAGLPGAGSYDATLNGAILSSSSTIPNGAIPHVDPGSGNAYLSRLSLAATQACQVWLLDRLWCNQLTVNSTSAQSPTTPTWPARDKTGSTNGDGVLIGIETSAAASATAATLTMAYTNQAGTGSRSASFAIAPTATATIAGAFFPVGLQAGDTGVRSVQTFTFGTAWTTGTINAVAYRMLAALELPGALIPNAIDALTSGFPRLYNGAVPFIVIVPNTTTSSNLIGSYTETQG
jgi:hypothetical protein